MSKTLVEMTAEIIQSQISGSNMSSDEIKAALHNTYQTLKGLQDAESCGSGAEEKDAAPAMDPKRSIRKNDIVCLECGQAFKMLTKHLKSHNMTAREYRKKYGFSSRQSLCAKALSDERSAASKERGIHPNLRKSIAERAGKKKKSA
ncbi:MAG: MucR family transcriptional regulator [Candidatus Electronema sp. VV]